MDVSRPLRDNSVHIFCHCTGRSTTIKASQHHNHTITTTWTTIPYTRVYRIASHRIASSISRDLTTFPLASTSKMQGLNNETVLDLLKVANTMQMTTHNAKAHSQKADYYDEDVHQDIVSLIDGDGNTSPVIKTSLKNLLCPNQLQVLRRGKEELSRILLGTTEDGDGDWKVLKRFNKRIASVVRAAAAAAAQAARELSMRRAVAKVVLQRQFDNNDMVLVILQYL
jgi:hypothetical protein